jgi:hypothetical protein
METTVLPTIAQAQQMPSQPISAEGPWEAWFAWRPVRLYMTGRLRWLCAIHRRRVSKHGLDVHEYTDDPDAYPCPPERKSQ